VPRLPIIKVESSARSAGSCTRGRLINGVQLPENPALYSIRNPDNSWGSSHAVDLLQRAIARFREDSGFDRELLVCDMSKQRGGRFRPHHSHTSGRDVDIQLPTKPGVPSSTIPREVAQVDWDATWALVSALVSTGQVKYIFLSRSRQRPLYEAALRAGERPESLRDFIQYPQQSKTALLRHSQGHVKHLHVRWKCAPHEDRCLD
jgi:murein endopeptidase